MILIEEYHNMIENIEIRKIRQKFCQKKIDNLPRYINNILNSSDLKTRVKPGDKVGITVGSRGIPNIVLILKEIIYLLKKFNVSPFILTAMGSHGGATSEGQLQILESYGINERSIGVPILSSMDTSKIGEKNKRISVYFSKEALKLDGIIALNRVKIHTDFHSNLVESGMSKILAIGLGKERGANSIHSFGVYGLKILPKILDLILKKAPIIQGIALLENPYEQILEIVCCPPEDIVKTDSKLLKNCREIIPRLPVDEIDVLIVQEIGKDISGTGLDTNIIGRLYINGEEEIKIPNIKQLVAIDLTEKSHGNAIGIGLADITTRKLVNKINYKSMYANAITCTFLRRAKIPIIANTEREAIEIALRTCWMPNIDEIKLIIIKNTLNLEYLYVSKAIWDKIKDSQKVEVCGDWRKISFNRTGQINERL